MRTNHFIATLALPLAVALASGCGPKDNSSTNAELLAGYNDNEYNEDIVTGEAYEHHEDQGDSISPRVLASINDTIETVYTTDFEHCLESEMERLETSWLGGSFTVQMDIGTDGNVTNVIVLKMKIGETRVKGKGKDKPKPRAADQFDECLVKLLGEWSFDPAPEANFTHTYNGKVGEAW